MPNDWSNSPKTKRLSIPSKSMSPDIHHEAERKESPSPQKLEQAATVANKHPKEVAAELRADPQSQSVLSGLWK